MRMRVAVVLLSIHVAWQLNTLNPRPWSEVARGGKVCGFLQFALFFLGYVKLYAACAVAISIHMWLLLFEGSGGISGSVRCPEHKFVYCSWWTLGNQHKFGFCIYFRTSFQSSMFSMTIYGNAFALFIACLLALNLTHGSQYQCCGFHLCRYWALRTFPPPGGYVEIAKREKRRIEQRLNLC